MENNPRSKIEKEKEFEFRRRREAELEFSSKQFRNQQSDPGPTLKEEVTRPRVLPGPVKSFFSGMYAPVRGFRGIGVGAEKLLQGVNPALSVATGGLTPQDIVKVYQNAPEALQRASAAVQPGYVPQPGEKLGAAVGETAGLAGLTAPIAGMAPAGNYANIMTQGGIGAGLTALQEGANKGTITPSNVMLGGAVGATPAILAKAAEVVGPSFFAATSKVPKSGYEAVRDIPNFFEQYPGTQGRIAARSLRIYDNFQKEYQGSADALNAYKKFLQIESDAETSARDIKAGVGNRTLAQIQDDFHNLIQSSEGVEKPIRTGMVDKSGKEIFKTIKTAPVPGPEKMRQLFLMDREIGKPEGPFAELAYNLKQRIKGELRKLPGGDDLIEANQAFGKVKQLGQDLGEHLTDMRTTTNEAKKIVDALIRNDMNSLRNSVDPRFAKEIQAIQRLEERTGKELLNPLKYEILSSQMKQPLANANKGMISKLLMLIRPDLAAAETAMGSPFLASRTMGQIGNVGRSVRSRTAKAVIPSAISVLRKMRDDK